MSQPNVLVYMSHDTGRFISPYGVSTVRTPNCERVAQEGIVLENYFCTAPQCSPSRAGMFTGRYPHSTGVLGLTHPLFNWDLSRSETHAAAFMHDLGYDTLGSGNLHEMHSREDRGFDTLSGTNHAHEMGAELAGWLDSRQHNERPFYAQLTTTETHRGFIHDGITPDRSLGVTVQPPLEDTPEVRDDFADFQGIVHRWDEGLGDVLQVLEERDLAEDTLLIVTTDHGIPFPRAKVSLYDPGIGVLCMLRWPNGNLGQGRRIPQLLSNVDLLPTVLDLVGGETAPNMHGRSFAPLLQGTPYVERERIFAEMTFHAYYDPMRCVRSNRYKYIRYFEMGKGVHMTSDNANSPSSFANRRLLSSGTGQAGQHPYEELFDLAADPYELTNLAEDPAYEVVRATFSRELAEWMRSTEDPLLDGPVASPFYHAAMASLGH